MPSESEEVMLRAHRDFGEFIRFGRTMGYSLSLNDFIRIHDGDVHTVVSNDSKPPKGMVNLRERHLTQDERQVLHKPASDWVESKKGDMCKNACAVEVKDIVDKYNKKTTA